MENFIFLQRRNSNRWLERNNGNRKKPVRKSYWKKRYGNEDKMEEKYLLRKL